MPPLSWPRSRTSAYGWGSLFMPSETSYKKRSMSIESVKRMVEEMHVDELEEMLERDYLRKLTRYKLIDESFRKKYGMTYEEFERKNIVAEKNYSWDVESDAQEWELAIDGISTCLRKLKELRGGY
jgi:hypothetical protein